MKKYKILLLLLLFFSVYGFGQECGDYYNYSKFVNCRKCVKKHYKTYLQPQNSTIRIKDTLKFNVVFSGNRDYIISFCTDQKYYPINIRLIEPETGRVIYNNVSDDYNTSIGVGFYKTQNVILEATLIAEYLEKDMIKSTDNVCVGLILQRKKVFFKKD